MDDRLVSLEERVDHLSETCESLRQRVTSLEARLETSVAGPTDEPTEEPAIRKPAVRRSNRLGALVGRSFVVLGGAFYLRALTDGGTLSRDLGVGLGLVYAALWLVMADRHSQRGWLRSAALHCLTGALIAFPLIWEAATAFDVLTVGLAVDLLMVFTALGLGVAWRGGQASIAWTTLVFGLLVALAFFVKLRAVGPVSAYLLATSAGAMFVAHKHDWSGLPWPPAILADLLFAAMGLAVLTEAPPWLFADEVFLAELGLVGVFLGCFAVRHLVLEREPTVFDGVQLIASFVIGFELAGRLGAEWGLSVVFGVSGLVLAVVVYAVTVGRVRRRQGRGATYFLYTSFGAIALADGLRFLPWEQASSMLLAAAALLAIWVGSRLDRSIFRSHAAFFVVAAGALSGLWGAAADAFFGRSDGAWRGFDVAAIVVLVGAAAAYTLARRWRPQGAPVWSGKAPEIVLLAAVLVGLGGAVVQGLAGPLATAGLPSVDVGALAVLRTAALSAAVIGLVLVARWTGELELRGLVTPLLVIALFKLAIEDLPRGRPGTLFLSLVFVGVALILAMGKRRRGGRTVGAADRAGESKQG